MTSSLSDASLVFEPHLMFYSFYSPVSTQNPLFIQAYRVFSFSSVSIPLHTHSLAYSCVLSQFRVLKCKELYFKTFWIQRILTITKTAKIVKTTKPSVDGPLTLGGP